MSRVPPVASFTNGVILKDGVAHAEEENFEALKKAVLASEAKKKEEEKQRRAALGLPPAEESRKGWFKGLFGRKKD